MHYYLWTIGCQMNFADSRRVAEELQKLGFQEAGRPEDADLVLLNTCVVRQSAEDKVVGRLTSLSSLKRRPQDLSAPPTVALMGCFVTEIPSLQRRYPWIDAFIKPSDIDSVIELAKQRATIQYLTSDIQPPTSNPVSAGIPISYGCDHLCTYCVVRLRRGPEVSHPVEEIVAEVQGLVGGGVKEITLLGQNVDSYAFGLADLLEAVHEVEGLERIRFLTSHPVDMADRLIETAARLPKVCEYVEIPVQSGDDAILRRMGRGYTVTGYRELVARIRAAMPGAGLATDVIVGFPGETEAQFQATYRLLEEVRFDVVHVAAYSPRPGTPAERLADDVPPEEKERRRKAVDHLQERIAGEINARLLGQTVEILVETRRRGKWQGRTRTHKLVFVPVSEEDWTGRLVPVRITWTGPWSMQAEVVHP
jgi:tRNA-2-methylthio-N6-dimethylallyladenosine synthase